MAGGQDGEHLVAVVRELHRELGYGPVEEGPDEGGLGASSSLWKGREEDGTDIVLRLRSELARLARAALGAGGERDGEQAVQRALDGAELVMRGEIAAGRPQMLDAHLPGIAFVVALPGLGHERALALSRRAAELLELG